MEQLYSFIGGRPMPETVAQQIDVHAPFGGSHLYRVASAGPELASQAISAADNAFKNGPWAQYSAAMRGAMLLKIANIFTAHRDELAQIESCETGRSLTEVKASFTYLHDYYRYYAGLADKVEGRIPADLGNERINIVLHEPLGVILGFVPWNAPLVLASMKIAPALAAGNVMVIKPHENAPGSLLRFAALCADIGLPAGVLNVVCGHGSQISEALICHPQTQKIAFTGGNVVARKIYAHAAAALKPVLMELGGKSPNIILADADLDKAAVGAARGVFLNAGQSCFAGSRVFVADEIADRFLPKLIAATQSLRIGPPSQEDVQIGTMFSAEQRARSLGFVQRAIAQGAVLLTGGHALQGGEYDKGWFMEPTILGNVTPNMEIAREEVFGPVMAIMRFNSLESLVELANDSAFGLAAGVWTRDFPQGLRVAKALQAGTVWMNTYRDMSYSAPFGGTKQSGFGRENGADALLEYMQTKTICVALS